MLKIRIEGNLVAIGKAIEKIKSIYPDARISKHYSNRDGETFRVYVDC